MEDDLGTNFILKMRERNSSRVFSEDSSKDLEKSPVKEVKYFKDLSLIDSVEAESNIIKCIRSSKTKDITKQEEKYLEFYNKIIIGNQEWIDGKKKQNPNYFKQLNQPQTPKYLVIACSDSRVVINEFTSTDPGDVFTQRNIGNMVISSDFNCQSVLQYAIEYLKVEHVIVIGHTDCGAIRAAMSDEHHGLIDHWLKSIREVAEKHEIELMNEEYETSVKKLIQLNVKEQCLNLCKSPIIQKAWDDGQELYIHGFMFDMETGKLIPVEVKQSNWIDVENIYKFKFIKSCSEKCKEGKNK